MVTGDSGLLSKRQEEDEDNKTSLTGLGELDAVKHGNGIYVVCVKYSNTAGRGYKMEKSFWRAT